MTPEFKRTIIEAKKKEVQQLRENFDLGLIRSAAFSVGTEFHSVQVALQESHGTPLVVPLQGKIVDGQTIVESYQPYRLAYALNKMNIPALLVATDRHYLGGDPSHINLVKTGLDVSVIQRDFFVDEAQIYIAKALGSDGILLDAGLLTSDELAKFTDVAFQTGMEPFLKIDDPAQLTPVETEIIGGIVLGASVFPKLKKSPEWEKIKTSQQGKIPVLIDNFVPSDESLKPMGKEEGVFYILAESWLAEKDPLAGLRQFVENIRKRNEQAG